MVKEIICKNGEVALCDDEDYPLLSRFIWYMGSELKRGGGYPCCFMYGRNNTRKQVFMHQMVMAGAIGTDHINQNKMDNRKENLRPVTHQQNGWNTGKRMRCRHGEPKSKYKGVSPYKTQSFGDGWQVIIKLTKKFEKPAKHVRLGPFKTEEEAALAYNAEIVKHRGEYAFLNQINPSRDSV